MKRLLMAALCVFSLAGWGRPVLSQESLTPEKRQDIAKLLEISGAASMGKLFRQVMAKQMVETNRSLRPDIPTEILKLLEEELTSAVEQALFDKGGYLEIATTIYGKYLSHDDIKGLLAFYATPLGQKTISVMPIIAQESIAAGKQWGEAIGPVIMEKVIARFRQKGIEL